MRPGVRDLTGLFTLWSPRPEDGLGRGDGVGVQAGVVPLWPPTPLGELDAPPHRASGRWVAAENVTCTPRPSLGLSLIGGGCLSSVPQSWGSRAVKTSAPHLGERAWS